MSAAAVRLEGVTVRRGRRPILADVKLTVAAGESWLVLGPNGSGKTTLLNVIAGLMRCDRGRVVLFGHQQPSPAARARVGYLAHEPLLYPQLTVEENLRFCARLYGLGDATARYRWLLKRVGMLGYLYSQPLTFSHGMRQRVAVVRALLPRPELLLLDEPFAGLDAAGRRRCRELFETYRREGGTLLLATHRPRTARDLCERVAILQRGRLARTASLEDPDLNRLIEGGRA